MNNKKVKIYLDAPNFNNRMKDADLRVKLDYITFLNSLPHKLKEDFNLEGDYLLEGVNYYITPYQNHKTDQKKQLNYQRQQKFFNFLRYNLPNFKIVEGKLKPKRDGSGGYFEKCVDTSLTTDIIRDGAKNDFDIAIIISSDPDYIPPIKTLINDFEKRVYVALPDHSVARELGTIASGQIKLDEAYINTHKLKSSK